MTKPTPKTPEEVAAKKQEFLSRAFHGHRGDITPIFIRQAWAETSRPMLYDDIGATMSNKTLDKRAGLRECMQKKTEEIAERIMNGDEGCFAYEGEDEAAQKAASMLAASGVSIKHIGHVKDLRNAVPDEYCDGLKGGEIKFGRAQKMLNMYLKYMWCAGKMSEPPPHCPFSRKITLRSFPPDLDEFWGTLGRPECISRKCPEDASVEDYLVWLAAADEMRKRLNFNSLAEWELFEFEERMAGR